MAVLALAAALAAPVWAQSYIGFVYPAGGRQGTTFRATLGGQTLDGIRGLTVSGSGVVARVVEYNGRMNNQVLQLLNEQLAELKALPAERLDPARTNLMARLRKFIGDYVSQPACDAIANLVIAEFTVAPDAAPGPRELRVVAARGLSNPLVFMVGQLPEVTPEPALTSIKPILGKESQALRRKARTAEPAGGDMMAMAMMGGPAPASGVDDDEIRIETPCTVNGQIVAGSVDRYRFAARKGQRMVIAVQARDLVPYMADAVPGWFQPVVALRDARGREVAFGDDYRFKPDPVLLCEIPADGDYQLVIHDAIFRGREDFVYRMTVGEVPFVTSMFPLGARPGAPAGVAVRGWNLAGDRVTVPPAAEPGLAFVTARGRDGLLSNRLPFAFDADPEVLENEKAGNSQKRTAQPVTLPAIVNGRIDKPGDRDVFRIDGKAGQEIVAEVFARRLDSPLDSVLRLTDASDRRIAVNDDHEDAGSGLNTHHADSQLRATLPADGTYYLQIADTQQGGEEEYAYRLHLGPPRPDFALRVVPSHVMLRKNSTATLAVHLIRKDGLEGPIRLELRDPPPGFSMSPVALSGTQTMTRITIKTDRDEAMDPVTLTVVGIASNGAGTVVRTAVPAEDRMQAFLWRHLVPAQELKAVVFAAPPSSKPEPRKTAETPRAGVKPVATAKKK
jgi:hypothetical protein